MRLLFISSGNSDFGISPIILNQAESIKPFVDDIKIFSIKGKGITGYLKNLITLKRFIRENNIDICHAHYSYSSYLASLVKIKPLVVSLMGSDVHKNNLEKVIIRFFNFFIWDKCIVKSQKMKKNLGIRKAEIVPNGVNMDKFIPLDKNIALQKTGWNPQKKHILFAADPKRFEKNYTLANESFKLIKNNDVELHDLQNIPNDKMVYYFNSCDVVLLTSFWEGSPNVIKEAMACNCPIVTTNVGDVNWILGKTPGCFIAEFQNEDVSNKLQEALLFNSKTSGRDHIKEIGVDSENIAKQLIRIYQDVLV
ncbi:MAG TPA: glycosyl transferase group 1 [Bacteroidales bacterium]|nr:glycosyl transferase group 1 [Bacteroidales bacterium]